MKALTQKLESVQEGKHNLHQHITDVLRQLLIDNPNNAYDLFEEYSLRIRNQRDGKSQPPPEFPKEEFEKLKSYIDKTKTLINVQNDSKVETQCWYGGGTAGAGSVWIRAQPDGGSAMVRERGGGVRRRAHLQDIQIYGEVLDTQADQATEILGEDILPA